MACSTTFNAVSIRHHAFIALIALIALAFVLIAKATETASFP